MIIPFKIRKGIHGEYYYTSQQKLNPIKKKLSKSLTPIGISLMHIEILDFDTFIFTLIYIHLYTSLTKTIIPTRTFLHTQPVKFMNIHHLKKDIENRGFIKHITCIYSLI